MPIMPTSPRLPFPYRPESDVVASHLQAMAGATLSTIYRGTFINGAISGVELVLGVSVLLFERVNFDVDVSPDGKLELKK